MKELLAGLLNIVTKIPTREILVTVCTSSWFFLLAPNPVLDYLGLLNFRDSQRPLIGLTVLISTTVLALLLVVWAWRRFRGWLAYSGRDAKRRLDAVGEWNRALIRQLYETPSHSQKLPLQNANVQVLLSENIIVHSPLGDAIGFDCVLQPWVVQYLDRHRDYVLTMKKFDEPFTCGFPLF